MTERKNVLVPVDDADKAIYFMQHAGLPGTLNAAKRLKQLRDQPEVCVWSDDGNGFFDATCGACEYHDGIKDKYTDYIACPYCQRPIDTQL